MKLRDVYNDIKTDYQYYHQLMDLKLSFARIVFHSLNPAAMAINLYRIYRYIYLIGLRPISWLMWQFNLYLTGADIVPSADIASPLFLGHPQSVVIAGKVGKYVKILGQSGIGGGMDLQRDVGAGPGLPVVCDHVQIGFRALILGAIKIGENARIAPMSLVTKDVPENATAIGNPCRIREGQGAKDVSNIKDVKRL